jgi:alginate O-acetyltransferase complex protein AlgI
MVFSSFAFIFGFLPVTLTGFWAISRIDHRISRLWLCLMSIVFYGWWNLGSIPVLLVSILVNYLLGGAIITRANSGRRTDCLLYGGIAFNVGALIYYKYLAALLYFLRLGTSIAPDHGLPLGISFFTFTQLAFLVDVSQGFSERYTPVNYLLFVTFFPHLIAGPIVHHRDLMPQFDKEKNYRFQPREFAIGLAIFSLGLAKKTLLADNVSPISNRLLSGTHAPIGAAWIGALAYSMQLYFDFSGYSDMAIGLARLFGIKFPLNFDSPYKATSIIDFWQRWHITLTRFLTGYLYNPIAVALVRRRAAKGLSTSKRAAQSIPGFGGLIALPTMITMLIAGIWHGAGLQFIIFGALHGIYISVNHAWRTFGPKHHDEANGFARSMRTLIYGALVYSCVLVAQIFFRADSPQHAVFLLADMIPAFHWPMAICTSHSILCLGAPTPLSSSGWSVSISELLILGASMIAAWCGPNTQEIMANYDPALELGHRIDASSFRVRLNIGWAIGLGCVLFLGLINIHDGQPFIYFQF